jgi:hypothetical protein
MTETHADANGAETQTPRARATARMRRSRARRRQGLRCCTLLLRDDQIATLLRRGLLRVDEQTDRIAIVRAMHAFLEQAFKLSEIKPPPYLAALERAGLAKTLGRDVTRNRDNCDAPQASRRR